MKLELMISHRITCTVQEPTGKPHDAAHIVSVGTGVLQNRYTDLSDLKDVLRLMSEGHSFYMESPSTGRSARVHSNCKTCDRTTIRTDADSIQDNNLDNLPRCSV